jgi:hypothetical protein
LTNYEHMLIMSSIGANNVETEMLPARRLYAG